MKGIARYFVATAAGAGLGACAALAQRHLVGPRAVVVVDPPAVMAPEAPQPVADAPPAPPAPEPEPEPVPAAAPPVDVADLDAARIRLRERAAALRAEMEGSAGVP